MIFPIFEDRRNPDRKDKFPTIPFPNKPSRRNGKEYRRRLEEVRTVTGTFTGLRDTECVGNRQVSQECITQTDIASKYAAWQFGKRLGV